MNSTFWIKLEDSQLLLVKGPDAAKFLQGQVTCDIRELAGGTTRMGAQCNPKGRILLTFRAAQLNQEAIALRIPVSMRDKAQQNLGKYIVFSKAKLIDARDDFQLFGLYGAQARELAGKMFPHLPENNNDVIEASGNFLIQLDYNRYECWVATSHSDDFSRQLVALAAWGAINDWTLKDIQEGIATIYPETLEVFTPQEINYQLINAVSFRKGCYTGQEIVARLHYRGKLKRHMYRFGTATGELPAAGTAVINSITGQTAGQVVMAARDGQQNIEILASVIDEHLDELILTAGTQNLKPLPLPYAIPTADEKNE